MIKSKKENCKTEERNKNEKLKKTNLEVIFNSLSLRTISTSMLYSILNNMAMEIRVKVIKYDELMEAAFEGLLFWEFCELSFELLVGISLDMSRFNSCCSSSRLITIASFSVLSKG
jgi:hypothetical protein